MRPRPAGASSATVPAAGGTAAGDKRNGANWSVRPVPPRSISARAAGPTWAAQEPGQSRLARAAQPGRPLLAHGLGTCGIRAAGVAGRGE